MVYSISPNSKEGPLYLEYWKLKERPFQNVFDPKYLYYSKVHEEALVRLLYTVSESKGLMFFTGPSGAGKTFLAKMFAQEVEKRGFRVAYVSSPDLSPLEFLQQVNAELGLDYKSASILIVNEKNQQVSS